MLQLGADEVLKLSPDDASAKAAKGLVIPTKWPRLEFNDAAIWGECQGSGAKPYQVQVDQSGPAFRCSCPSRKFPCKHGLALLLLLAQHSQSFSRGEPPAWVSDWLDSRRERAEKQTAKPEAPATPKASDPQATAKREAARQHRMGAGVDELERWLNDRIRQGLAPLPSQPGLWDEVATHMVDAQLPGLAYRLRRIGGQIGREGWPAQTLGQMGQLRLLIDAYRRLDSLPQPIQADVRAALGLNIDRDTVLSGGEQVADDWRVLGQRIDEEDRLWLRRVWLQGVHSGRKALLLDYAHGSRRFDQHYLTASCVTMTLAYFPGNAPLRARVVGDTTRVDATGIPGPITLNEALDELSHAVAANPWQSPRPLLVSDASVQGDDSGWYLLAPGGQRLNLILRAEDGWRLRAESGGVPLTLFGEWEGFALRPLSVWNSGLVWTDEGASA